MKSGLSLLVLSLFFSFYAFAQDETGNGIAVTGRVIDSLTHQPVIYATVGLFTEPDNKVVNGTTTDSVGGFKMMDVKPGTYTLVVEFIGYKKLERKHVDAGKTGDNISIGEIKLSSTQISLKEVTVTGDASVIENKIDKMVYNVEKDVTSQTGVAADVMKKIPEVSVDVDGNVELQGNSDIRFLINGKPSILYGSNITEVLQSIPSSQIKSIEVITSPGAKYEAEGTGGIINIILKKTTAQGTSGNISLSAGTRLENGSLNLNARHGSFGINAFVSGNAQLKSTTINSQDRTSQDSASSSELLQNGKSDFMRQGYQSGIGFDWDVNRKNSFTATAGYNYFSNSTQGSAERQTLLHDLQGGLISEETDSIVTENKFHNSTFNFDVEYKHKFNKEDHELQVLVNSSMGDLFSYYNHVQKHLSSDAPYDASYGKNPGKQNESNAELNYTLPFSKDAMLEAGGKTEYYHLTNSSDVYLLNTATDSYDFNASQSSATNYKRMVNAGYVSMKFKVFKGLDAKAGYRDEYTMTHADYANAGAVNVNPYNTAVPSLLLSHMFKNKQLLKLSYTHRIQRPDYRDLNPFHNASDPKNITSGNPDIKPEVGNRVELGYSGTSAKGITITTSFFYRGNRNDIQSYTRYYPTYQFGDSVYTNVAVSKRENIGHEDNYGLSVFASIPAKEKFNFRLNAHGFERYIVSGISPADDIHGFMYHVNGNITYEMSSTFLIELFANFNSAKINAQGTMPSFTTYNAALRKELFHKNGSIAVTATNFLDEYVNQKTNLSGDNFTLSSLRELPYRSFGVNFTYKFGKLEFKKQKEQEDINLNPPEGN